MTEQALIGNTNSVALAFWIWSVPINSINSNYKFTNWICNEPTQY